MSDQPTFTITATRSQLVRAMLDLLSDTDLSDDGPGAGHAVDAFLHYVDPQQFPVHPDDAPPAVATGPVTFQPVYPGSPTYYRIGDPSFVLIVDPTCQGVRVLGPAPYPSGSLAVRPTVHTVQIIDGDLDDAIAAAAAAVDHMSGR